MRLIAACSLLVLACSPAPAVQAPPPPPPPPAPTTPAAVVKAQEPEPAKAEPCDKSLALAELEETMTAPFDDILVQLDVAHAPMTQTTPGGGPSARVPEFTLLRDGTTLRRTPKYAAVSKLDPAAASAFVERLVALGAGRLKSHVETCSCPNEQQSVECVSDAGLTILRVRVGAALHHVVVYASFWNEPATAEAILAFIRAHKPVGETRYVPKAATLAFVTWRAKSEKCAAIPAALAHDFERPKPDIALWLQAVDGAELASLSKVLELEPKVVCVKTERYYASLFPWLPGADHHRSLEKWQRETIGN